MKEDVGELIRTGKYVIGREAFAKISAIEGIYLTPEMEKDLDMFEEQNLSDSERRAFLIHKYGTPRSSKESDSS